MYLILLRFYKDKNISDFLAEYGEGTIEKNNRTDFPFEFTVSNLKRDILEKYCQDYRIEK
jgi:hypothetical protein